MTPDEGAVTGPFFWSVYVHQTEGGVACVANLSTIKKAEAFAAGLYVAWQGFSAVVHAAQAVIGARNADIYIAAIKDLARSVKNIIPAPIVPIIYN